MGQIHWRFDHPRRPNHLFLSLPEAEQGRSGDRGGGKEPLLDFLPSISALVSSVSAARLVETTETCIALGLVSSLFTSKFESQDFAEYFKQIPLEQAITYMVFRETG